MVDDRIMVRSAKRTRQLDTPSGGGGAGRFRNMEPRRGGLLRDVGGVMLWTSLRGFWRECMFNIKQTIGDMV